MVTITKISGYTQMWSFVLFDLPTETKTERKQYREFRNSLLNLGFLQLQYSVYIKECGSKEITKKIEQQVQNCLPKHGKIYIFSITDKQYTQMRLYFGKQKQPKNKSKDENQLLLF